jgi:hypothetical protein
MHSAHWLVARIITYHHTIFEASKDSEELLNKTQAKPNLLHHDLQKLVLVCCSQAAQGQENSEEQARRLGKEWGNAS